MLIKNLKRQAGFGLVEVMVAASILGGLSLVVMKLNESGIQGVSRVEKSMDIVQLDGEINSYMSTQDGCLRSVQSSGSPVSLAAITGTTGYPFQNVIDRNLVTRFTTGQKRGSVTLNRMYVSNYGDATATGPGTGNAYLFKEYTFKLSPSQTVTKTKRITLSIKSSDGTNVTGCATRATETDSVWTVDDSGYGIYYQNGTVAIGTEVPTLVPYALNVQGGDIFLGGAIDNNSNLNAYPQNNQILGGEENVLANGVTDSVMMNGNQNSILSGASVITLGGYQNIAEGNFSSVINSPYSVVQNTVGGNGSAVLGGSTNIVVGKGHSILGGYANIIYTSTSSARGSAIIGGYNNSIYGNYAYNNIVLGGANNTVIETDNHGQDGTTQGILISTGSYLNSGWNNKIIATEGGRIESGVAHVLLGGNSNGFLAGGTGGQRGTIIGGDTNSSTGGNNISILGGTGNRIDGGDYSGIIGGMQNVITGSNSTGSMIIGSVYNTISNTPYSMILASEASKITANYSVILGGYVNQVNSWESAVVGGAGNTIGTASSFAGIVAGTDNVLLASRSAILAGRDNTVSVVGTSGTGIGMLGGRANLIGGATSSGSSIVGGFSNYVTEQNSAVMSGAYNSITTGSGRSVVTGGSYNRNDGYQGAISGGSTNRITGGTTSSNSGVFGGYNNLVSNQANSIIIGGSNHSVDGTGAQSGGIVMGGNASIVRGSSVAIGGWGHNAGCSNCYANVVIGGEANTSYATAATSIGGFGNIIEGGWKMAMYGGAYNTIAGIGEAHDYIFGGLRNKISGGAQSIILGGNYINVNATGTIVLGDSNTNVLSVATNNTMVGRFAGGYRFYSDAAGTIGVSVGASGNSWAAVSDRNKKEDFQEIDENEILQKVSELWVPSWVYKDQKDKSKRVIGPMAQDFYRLFAKPYSLTSTNKTLVEKDVEGVLLLSVKALKKENDELKNRVKSLEEEMREIRAEMKQLRRK